MSAVEAWLARYGLRVSADRLPEVRAELVTCMESGTAFGRCSDRDLFRSRPAGR